MLVPEFVIPTLTTICICGSIFIINNHCIKREKKANENQGKYVILTEETYNSIINIQKQPTTQEYPQYGEYVSNKNTEKDEENVGQMQSPPIYNEIDTMK